MSETARLPEGWGSATLADLAAFITSGATPEAGNPRYYTQNGGYAFAKIEDLTRARTREIEHCSLRITHAAVRETAAKVYPAGTILLSMYGTIGLAKVCAGPLAANQALCALLPPYRCDPGYLLHHLDYVRPQWSRYSGQTTQANINGAIVRTHEVPLPPRDDQVKIAEVLNTLDTTIRQTDAIIEKLKLVKQGLLHNLLTRGIDANGELRPPQSQAPHLYKNSPLGWIPLEWSTLALDEIRDQGRPITYGVLKPGPFVPDGVPLLQIQDVIHGTVDVGAAHRISSDLDRQYLRTRVTGGEIVISLVGTIGRVARLPERIEPSNLHRNLGLIAIEEEQVPEYFSLFMQSDQFRTSLASSTLGSTQSLLNLASLRSQRVPCPTPRERAQIAAVLQAMNDRCQREVALRDKLCKQKSGLMDDLLTGRVRVTPLLQSAPASA